MPQFQLTPNGWAEDPNPPGMPARTGEFAPAPYQVNAADPQTALSMQGLKRQSETGKDGAVFARLPDVTHVGVTRGYHPNYDARPAGPADNWKYFEEMSEMLHPGWVGNSYCGSSQIAGPGGIIGGVVIEAIGPGNNPAVRPYIEIRTGVARTLVASLAGLAGAKLTQTITDAVGVWLVVVGNPSQIKVTVSSYKTGL